MKEFLEELTMLCKKHNADIMTVRSGGYNDDNIRQYMSVTVGEENAEVGWIDSDGPRNLRS